MYSYLRKKPGDNRTAPSTRNVFLPHDAKTETDNVSISEHGHTSSGLKEHSHSSTNTMDLQFPLVRRKLGIKPIRPQTQALSSPDIPKENIKPAESTEDKEPKHDLVEEAPNPSTTGTLQSTVLAVNKDPETPQPTLDECKETGPKSCAQVGLKSPGSPALEDRKILVNGKTYIAMCAIGRGGSSKVYQVVDNDSTEVYALKVVHMDALDPLTAKGYLNEVELLQKLQGSSHVVRLFDFEYCKKEQKLFLVMERGETDLASLLRTQVKEQESVDPFLVRYYWKEMLRAVHCIHQNNIIHADLKPANFLLVGGKVKLIDFGIATSVQADMTSVIKESQAGTFNYMAPEAIKPDNYGYKISKKSDIWSLGCILYNMVYGHTPFQHITSPFAKLSAIVDDKHVINFPECQDKRAVEVMRLCLDRNPKQRPDTQQLLNHPILSISSYIQ